MRVAIIGGGWAGLAAAVELAASGAQVTVFEAARHLGGRARKADLRCDDAGALDNGQHLLIGAYHETLRVMRIAGADPEQMLLRLPLEVHHRRAGRVSFRLRLPRLPAPWHLAWGLLFADGATLAEKVRAARMIGDVRRAAYRLADDCPVSLLLDRYRQRGRLRSDLWEALCLAALNTPPAHASARVFLATLRDTLGAERSATDLLLPTVDLSSLFPEAAARFVRAHGGSIHLSSRVRRIEDGLHIVGEPFAHVVLATAPRQAAALLAEIPETREIARTLAEYGHEPIATVYCRFPAAVRLPFPMLGLASESGLAQWAFDRGALGGAAGLIAFVLSASGAWQQLDNAALATALQGELAIALGTALPQAQWTRVIREQHATFSCRPNLPRPATRTGLPGLWLAGDYTCAEYPATLEAAVRSGVAAARGILGSNAAERQARGAGLLGAWRADAQHSSSS